MTLLARPWDSRSHEKCSFHFSQFWCEIYMQDLGEIYATFMQDVTTRELISLFLWFCWFAIIHVRMLYACRHMSGNEHTKKSDENTKKRRTYTPPPPKLPTQTPISWQPLCRFHWNLSPSFAKNHPTATRTIGAGQPSSPWLFLAATQPHKSQKWIYKIFNVAQLSVLLLGSTQFLCKTFSWSSIFTRSIKHI